MIHGRVNNAIEATVRIKLFGPTGAEVESNAMIDTGFTGTITLPVTLVEKLNLTYLSDIETTLADGQTRDLAAYQAELEWDGIRYATLATETGRQPLIGMKLLLGRRVCIDVWPGGAVEIRQIHHSRN